jgi:uncharacterized iron-regulated membrane protein
VNYARSEPIVIANAEAIAAEKASRRWRAVWRTHFYAGIFSVPFLLLMAFTGLIILYSQPIRNLTQGSLRQVTPAAQAQSLETQRAAVVAAFPDAEITTVKVPANPSTATVFGLEGGKEVFVNPYSAKVLGRQDSANDLVGLANRWHGQLNNENLTVSLPSLSGLLGSGAVMQSYVLTDVLLEVFAGWCLVLVASGIYLWWPRRSRVNGGRVTKALFVPRVAKAGRARWRDLHSIPGLVLSAGLAFVLVTGMPWASYWGPNFTAAANKITPNKWVEAPNSGVAKLGDLDRFGSQINWNVGNATLPNSSPPAMASVVNLDTLAVAAKQEGMKPGYSISFPKNGTDDAGNPTSGSFTLENSWPRKTEEAKAVYLDQFSGQTISTMNAKGYGTVSRTVDTGVSIHMGTQFGLATRIVMTAVCVLTIWSIISGLVMFLKRRRPGTVGLPRRPRDIKLANRLIVMSVVLGLVYPLWGVSALVILGFDKFVIRKIPRTRTAFGQR